MRRLGIQDEAEAVFDDAVRVLVDRGDEQRFLVREVDVHGGAAEVRVARDIGDRRGAVPVAREAGDGSFEEDAARARPFRRDDVELLAGGHDVHATAAP